MSRSLKLLGFLAVLFFFSCQKEVSYETGGPSHGSLQSSSGNCLPSTVSGDYIAQKAANDSNYVDVTINVTQAGTYKVVTDTINGYSFSATGTFSNTGTNVVRLKAYGTPLASGTDNFMVMYDTTICSFSVNVLPEGSQGSDSESQNHFVLSLNSYWTYNDLYSQGDTVKRTIVDSAVTQNGTYKIMREESPKYQDSIYYHKVGNDYYEYTYPDAYANLSFDQSDAEDFLFLKEGLSTNDTWNSPEYTGTYTDTTNGQSVPVKLQYLFTCTDANATVTVNGMTFSSVYKITMQAQVSKNGAAYTNDLTWVTYYAKGVGIIYQSVALGGDMIEGSIRHYEIH